MSELQTIGIEWERQFKHLRVDTHLHGAVLPQVLCSATNLASLREPQIMSLHLK